MIPELPIPEFASQWKNSHFRCLASLQWHPRPLLVTRRGLWLFTRCYCPTNNMTHGDIEFTPPPESLSNYALQTDQNICPLSGPKSTRDRELGSDNFECDTQDDGLFVCCTSFSNNIMADLEEIRGTSGDNQGRRTNWNWWSLKAPTDCGGGLSLFNRIIIDPGGRTSSGIFSVELSGRRGGVAISIHWIISSSVDKSS